MNTNIDDQRNIVYALTAIKGIGRRFAAVVCKKADVDMNKRAGEITEDDLKRIQTVMNNPAMYKIPQWFLNRQRDVKDGGKYKIKSMTML